LKPAEGQASAGQKHFLCSPLKETKKKRFDFEVERILPGALGLMLIVDNEVEEKRCLRESRQRLRKRTPQEFLPGACLPLRRI